MWGVSPGSSLHPRFAKLVESLPQGGTLPPDQWERRHKALTAVLWVATAILAAYSLEAGYGAGHSMAHLGAVGGAAILASSRRASARARSLICSFGLLTAAALGVHTSGGVIEAHFAFFVFVVALTLYEDWTVFLLTVAYVLAHHGVLGMVDPQQVFHERTQFEHPWKWATIHAVFVAASGVAGVFAWRLNEDVRKRMLETEELQRAHATTDSLTGLPNRRQLMVDLEAAVGQAVAGTTPQEVLALYDLDGFKAYNDSFGHPAGDALLTRLGRRLERAVEHGGRAYRLGGDEFCVLTTGEQAGTTVKAGFAALTERGEAFDIGSSYGTAVLGDEAKTMEEALRLADQRMYERKACGARSAGAQSTEVLLRALAERYPDLGSHGGGVADLAADVAQALLETDDQVELVRQAARLHDIGKVAIPDAIIDKPGPLDAEEWDFIRRHTLIGERIIAGAPSLVRVAQLVRASHEEFDGNGYPDGLAGEEIPIGARIICACDAYDAMVTDRPYKTPLTPSMAAAELERCAGTQFDPRVVSVLVDVVRSRPPSGTLLAQVA